MNYLIVLKSGLFFILGCLIIYLMQIYNLIDLNFLKHAFLENTAFILLILLFQFLNIYFMYHRYFTVMRLLEVSCPKKTVRSATFVANGIGQWLPGSAAFIELIRIGILLSPLSQEQEAQNPPYHTRLLAASLIDRLAGLFVMLLVGALLSFFVYFTKDTGIVAHEFLILFAFISFFGAIFIAVMLFLCSSEKVIALLSRMRKRAGKTTWMDKVTERVLFEMEKLSLSLSFLKGKEKIIFICLSYSLIAFLCFGFGLYFSALAIGTSIPLMAVLASLSVLSLATLFPIGFGNFGGAQLVSAAVLYLFGVGAQSATGAHLLQSTLGLIIVSCSAIFFAKNSFEHIKAAFKNKKPFSSIM